MSLFRALCISTSYHIRHPGLELSIAYICQTTLLHILRVEFSQSNNQIFRFPMARCRPHCDAVPRPDWHVLTLRRLMWQVSRDRGPDAVRRPATKKLHKRDKDWMQSTIPAIIDGGCPDCHSCRCVVRTCLLITQTTKSSAEFDTIRHFCAPKSLEAKAERPIKTKVVGYLKISILC